MSGVKGKSGRKPKSLNREQAMRSLTLRLPKAIRIIEETMDGIIFDRLRFEAAVFVKESCLGKAVQSTSLDITGGEALTASLVANLFAMLATKRKELEIESRKQLEIEKTGREDVVE